MKVNSVGMDRVQSFIYSIEVFFGLWFFSRRSQSMRFLLLVIGWAYLVTTTFKF
jgi:hypothetical protein